MVFELKISNFGLGDKNFGDQPKMPESTIVFVLWATLKLIVF